MADLNDNDNGETFETVQASAEAAQTPSPLEALVEVEQEPSAEELVARQAAMGELRKSGPPLPEGEDSAASALEALVSPDEPTEVEEPRPQDC